MIVVAIIGILAAIAIPAYQDYTVRSKVTEGLNLAAAAKLAVSETWQSNGSLTALTTGIAPCGAGIAYCFTPTKFVAQINLNSGPAGNGEIEIVYDVTANGIPALTAGPRMFLVPTIGTPPALLAPGLSGNIDFHCKSAGSTFGLGSVGTVEARYAPAQCRGAV
jgi:type IV pilus assembly protein PilA